MCQHYNYQQLKHKTFIRDIEVKKKIEKLYNTMKYTSFYLYVSRKIIYGT